MEKHSQHPFYRLPGNRFATSKWIWPLNERKVNGHVLFRTVVECDESARQAWMFIAVESFARVFINGEEVLRTSSLSYPGQHYCESVELSSYLTRGKNEIAIVAWYIGVPSGSSCPKDPGLLAEVVSEDGSVLCASSANWRALSLDAWIGQVRRSHWLNLDLVEILDFRRLPAGFPMLKVDDQFGPPEATNYPGARYIQVEPRLFAKPCGETVRPFTIVEQGYVKDRSGEEEIPSKAVIKEPIEPCDLKIEDLNDFILEAPLDGNAWSIVLDLGTYEKGFPRLLARGDSGTEIDVSWYEDIRAPRWKAEFANVYATDRFILSGGADEIVPEEWKSGRYLQLTFRKIKSRLRVENLRWEQLHYPLKRKARITSSSPKLERIMDISLRAAALCMHDNIMDCPWRERRQWIADAQRIGLISYYAFGEFDMPRAILKQHVRLQDISGRMWPCLPVNEEFPSQSMEWLRAVIEYTDYSGDKTLLPEISLNIELLHRWFLKCRDERDLLFLDKPPVMNWMDNTYGSNISFQVHSIRNYQLQTPYLALNLRYLLFLDDVSIALGQLGMKTLASEADAERSRLAEAIVEHFYDPELGLFRDCADTKIPLTISEMGQALAVRAELPGIDADVMWRRFLDYRSEHESEVIGTTPFGKYHTLEALAKLGQTDALVEEIMQNWGPMVDADSDTTWEAFNGRGSRCHGWAGIPFTAIMRHVLKLDPRTDAKSGKVESIAGIDWISGEIDD